MATHSQADTINCMGLAGTHIANVDRALVRFNALQLIGFPPTC